MLYLKKPKDFKQAFEVASCFLEKDGKILLLHRQDSKPQGDRWGMPAGKIQPGESVELAMLRELYEETGYTPKGAHYTYICPTYVRFPEYDFVYHLFRLPITDEFQVRLDPRAHKDFCWVTPREALTMNAMADLDACIKIVYGEKPA